MPDAPITVDVSFLSGPWPGITLSGVTGPSSSYLNGDYKFFDNEGAWEYHNVDLGGSLIRQVTPPTWTIERPGDNVDFEGEGSTPWAVQSWTPVGDGAGTPVLVRFQTPPLYASIAGDIAATHATMGTDLTGTNNDLDYTAVPAGRLGNAIFVEYINPGTNNAALAVSVSNLTVTVRLATNGSAVITSTAAQVKATIEASPEASALVTVAHRAGNNGTGVVTAMAGQDLADGIGGLPLPPVTVDL